MVFNKRKNDIYCFTYTNQEMETDNYVLFFRYMFVASGVNSMLRLRSNDRIYNAMPLYHTAGGIIGAGQALLRGVTVVLRRRFSASKFWSDCIHYECTV